MSDVSIVRSASIPDVDDFASTKRFEKVKNMVKEAVDLVGGFESIVNGAEFVIVKPNLVVSTPPGMHLTTDPHVTASVALLAKEAGARKVAIAEHPALVHKGKDAFKITMTEEVGKKVGAEILYLDESKFVPVEVKGARIHREMRVPQEVLKADAIISVPKMKTHWLTRATLGIKNLLGFLPPDEKLKYHREDIHQKLVDILRLIKPKLAVVDGLTAMEGQGPRCGSLVDFGTIVAGKDVVSVDAVTSYVMGFDPSEIQETRIASKEGLGVGDLSRINVHGLSLDMARRSFKRASIDLANVFDGVDVYLGGACKACLGFTRAALDGLELERKLGKKKLTLIIGQDANIPEKVEGKIVVVGDCAKKHAEKGLFVEGCPAFKVYWKVAEAIGEKTPVVLDGLHI